MPPKHRPVLLRHRAEDALMALLERLAAHGPVWLWTNFGAALGILAARLLPIRRGDIRGNLRIAFGDSIDSTERCRLEREAYKHIAMVGAETLCLARRPVEDARTLVVEHDGPPLEEVFDPRRAPIVATAHLGNWEVFSAAVAQQFPSASLAKPLHNPLMQERVARARERYGLEILWTGPSDLPKRILRALRAGKAVGFLADQDMRMEGIFVDFFGTPACTTPGPATFALRTGRPIVPAFVVRLGPASHRLVVRPPIDPATARGETQEEKVRDLTQRFTAEIEDMVRLHPAQYFWLHRRWKTTPDAVRKRRDTLARERREALAAKQER